MYIQQLYTNCLAEAAYYIESDGESAIIDPIRETAPYIALAKERNTKIKYVFETHFHADFVSGHIDLARQTGSQIVFGPNAETGYEVIHAQDGDTFKIGKLTIQVLHTPGHTLESSCYLLLDEQQNPYCIFTGDTLFVGDVGRPDLLDGVMSKEELAAMMFESLKNKIKILPDNIIVYPAHGPGSACGKNIGKETWSTIGVQKKTNYALLENDKDKFIEALTVGLTPPPMYFFDDARINKTGYSNHEVVLRKNMKPLNVNEAGELLKKGALILDTRIADKYEKSSIPGSINIGLNGSFAVWVGTIVPMAKKLILITEADQVQETVNRLARVGYENVAGFLNGGMEDWIAAGKTTQQVPSVNPEDLMNLSNDVPATILDVRKPGEYDDGHVKDSVNLPLNLLTDSLDSLDKSANYYIYCAGGYRSMIAGSIMKANGFDKVTNVYGGYSKIKETGIALEIPQTA